MKKLFAVGWRHKDPHIKEPHVHVYYAEPRAIVSITDGSILGGSLSPHQLKYIQKWVKDNQDELIKNWTLLKFEEIIGQPKT